MQPVFFWDKEAQYKSMEMETAQSILNMQNDTFNKEEFSDFKVICADGKEFKVNTYFLRLHSDVLTAFLDNDSAERKTRTLKLSDLDANLVEAMLRFCYNGKVKNLNEIAEELYMLADRYNIMQLQTMCLHNMYTNLSKDNILRRLEHAISMELPQLKEQAMDYAVLNINQILELPQWSQFTKDNPEIVSSILTTICKEKKKSEDSMSWLKVNRRVGVILPQNPGPFPRNVFTPTLLSSRPNIFGNSNGPPSGQGALFENSSGSHSGQGTLFGATSGQNNGGQRTLFGATSGQNNGGQGASFGASSGQSQSGQNAGQTSSKGLFGSPSGQSSGQSQSGQNAGQSSSKGLFGSPSGQNSVQSQSGQNAGQSSSKGLFGSPSGQSQSKGLFGSPSAQPKSGQSAGQAPSKGLFGSPSGQNDVKPQSKGLFGSLSGQSQLNGQSADQTNTKNADQPQSGQNSGQSQSKGLFGLPSGQPQSKGIFGLPSGQPQSKGLFGLPSGQSQSKGLFGLSSGQPQSNVQNDVQPQTGQTTGKPKGLFGLPNGQPQSNGQSSGHPEPNGQSSGHPQPDQEPEHRCMWGYTHNEHFSMFTPEMIAAYEREVQEALEQGLEDDEDDL